jgi:hypothetical protein
MPRLNLDPDTEQLESLGLWRLPGIFVIGLFWLLLSPLFTRLVCGFSGPRAAGLVPASPQAARPVHEVQLLVLVA